MRFIKFLILLPILLGVIPICKKNPPRVIHQGIVLETMKSGGYTYLRIEENGTEVWAASMPFEVEMGDKVRFNKEAPMKDFISPSLKRKFATIYFVDKVYVNDEKEELSEKDAIRIPHAKIESTVTEMNIQPGSIKKAEGGYTVAECYAKKKVLKGKLVKVRGRVVKFNEKILGHNWIHIQDGSGTKSTRMLAATTRARVKIGDKVLLSGKIVYDMDFGSGYIYPVLIENAAVTME